VTAERILRELLVPHREPKLEERLFGYGNKGLLQQGRWKTMAGCLVE
jgi:hypothetical protein